MDKKKEIRKILEWLYEALPRANRGKKEIIDTGLTAILALIPEPLDEGKVGDFIDKFDIPFITTPQDEENFTEVLSKKGLARKICDTFGKPKLLNKETPK